MIEKMSYEEFKNKIKSVLKTEPEGLTWTEIRKKANLHQKFPANQWVRRMEKDIGLVRTKKAGKMIWRLS